MTVNIALDVVHRQTGISGTQTFVFPDDHPDPVEVVRGYIAKFCPWPSHDTRIRPLPQT